MPRKANLFQELKQGDPRAVALTCLLLFLGSLGWLGWVLYGPQDLEVPTISGVGPRTELPEMLPLSERIDAQQEIVLGPDAPNPFFLSRPRRPERPAPPPRPEVAVRPQPERPRPQPLPPPPPPPPPETVTYTLRGILTRPDGARVAQIHNSRTNRSEFIQAGADLPPWTVDAVEQETVLLQGSDNGPLRLRRGEPQTFTLP